MQQVVFDEEPQVGPRKKINVRFTRYEMSTPIKKIKSNYIGKVFFSPHKCVAESAW